MQTNSFPPAGAATALHADFMPILGKKWSRLELHKLTGHVVFVRPGAGVYKVNGVKNAF